QREPGLGTLLFQLRNLGILSSLHPQNLRQHPEVAELEKQCAQTWFPLLLDPQTAGGLLASVPAAQADACVADLRSAGYDKANAIGEVASPGGESDRVRVLAES